MITHTIESYWIPSQKMTKSKLQILKIRQIFEFWNGHYTRHTFWSCLIRCANMKWIRWELLKIQSGHDSVHRRTDGQGDTSIPPYQQDICYHKPVINVTSYPAESKQQTLVTNIFVSGCLSLNLSRLFYVIGFNHGLPWCVKYMARGPPVTTKPDGEAGGFCGDRRPEGHVFHTSRQAMIKTYYSTSI